MERSFNVIGRILLAHIFILSGWSKIGGYAGTQGYMESMGVPGGLLPLVIAVELIGGLLKFAIEKQGVGVVEVDHRIVRSRIGSPR